MESNSIEVVPRDEKFVVIIREDGELFEREFAFEEHANAWANGQHIRLVKAIQNAPVLKGEPNGGA